MDANSREKPWVLRAAGLALGYGDETVVEDIDLEVDLGDVWFLVGAGGSGKTTFLHALLGMIAARSGSIELNPALGNSERVGYVAQTASVHHGMPSTVEELVRLGLVGSPIEGRHAAERIEAALETTSTLELRQRDVSTLSDAALQRVLLARALVRRPTLLVLDEPTARLDAAAGEDLLSLVDALNRERQVTVVCATRDVDAASRHATHAAAFAAGRVRAGAGAEVLGVPEPRASRAQVAAPARRAGSRP
jgi:ABC-type Mn2+/Zn2+ transport system ATPase subunit